MNGVHCQTSDAITATFGISEIQSGWIGVGSPSSLPTHVSRPLNRP